MVSNRAVACNGCNGCMQRVWADLGYFPLHATGCNATATLRVGPLHATAFRKEIVRFITLLLKDTGISLRYRCLGLLLQVQRLQQGGEVRWL